MFLQPASVDLNKLIIMGPFCTLYKSSQTFTDPLQFIQQQNVLSTVFSDKVSCQGNPSDLARCGGLDQQPSFTLYSLIYCLAMPVRVKENLYLLEDKSTQKKKKKVKNHILFIKKHLLYLSKSGCQTKHRKHTIIQFLLSMFAFIGNSANSNIDCSVVYCPEQENHLRVSRTEVNIINIWFSRG